MQRRDRGVAQSLGGPLTKRVKESRVLLVGAGGIGCELLKNLVCCGFGSYQSALPTEDGTETSPAASHVRKAEVVVIDLDTIDLSNLNRQFLFRKQHIKKPKAFVAKETASQFNPSVAIDAQHASIFDSTYNVEFFEGFDIVFNALDNLAARRHVNKMCLAADVPLVESGTTGFMGQVQAIKKGVTECYDCNPKPVQKSFPICTIRSTPSQPIHCIVWAKSYLFPELFGTSEEDSADMAVTEGDNAEEVAKLKEEAEALKKVRRMMGKSEFAQEVFNKVFHDDIERLRSMTEMWQSRKPPEPLSFQSLSEGPSIVKQGQTLALQDQRAWTLLENISVFCYSLETLSNRVQGGENVIEFDKDDKDTLDFVTSAANLRSHVFGIPLHSEWEIKQMAGNIIPAIATSNALTASLCVMEAFKILRSQPAKANALAEPTANNHIPTKAQSTAIGKPEELLGGSKMVFLTSKNTDRLITSQPLVGPKADCPVCSPVYAKLAISEERAETLKALVDLLKRTVGYKDFSMTTEAGIIYDPDLEDNLQKPLSELGITGQSNGFITVTDDSDEPKVDLVLSTTIRRSPVDDAEATGLQITPKKIELPLKPEAAYANGDMDGDAEPEPVFASSAGAKRKRETEEEVESAKKRAKSDVYVVEDDGAILLDD
ncbi:E1 ubiquitin-activating protein uba2 [Vermiconidia calcicola]|uniref:E1 ubiquitin-activating protein uba2 n=1 Tax=Vermiconidia calcicola TaxID=1690605 RepID=A0ACC3NQA8_9PEZI|nr:E1 ubiquitin-activating protein uba2 [Vermiconidia calcicola]